jgi:hypothetical protein
MRPSAILAIVVALVVAAMTAADLLLLDYFGPFIVLALARGTFAGVGLIVALRRPRHPIGWLLIIAGACFALDITIRAYAWRALIGAPDTLPGGEVGALMGTFTSTFGLFAILVMGLIFPTGSLLSRRWVGVLVPLIVGVVANAVARAFAPRPILLPYALTARPDVLSTIPNPAGVSGPVGDFLLALFPVLDATLLPLVLLCLLGIVVRFVRSRGIERLQVKWFVYAMSLSLGFFIAAGTLPRGTPSDVAWFLGVMSEGLIPIAVGIAILRHRLYDIDTLINRTAVYGATTAAIAATFFLGLVALQPVLRPITNGSDLAVAAATLLSFGLFQPIRRRVQDAIDRHFDRSRYDAARTLELFAERLRDEVDLDTLGADLLGAVRQTMAPAHASLWLRERTG